MVQPADELVSTYPTHAASRTAPPGWAPLVMVQPADELVSTHARSTYRAAEVGSTTPVEMTQAKPATAIMRKRFGRNNRDSSRDNDHNHCDLCNADFFM
jgi:hypothetical protein